MPYCKSYDQKESNNFYRDYIALDEERRQSGVDTANERTDEAEATEKFSGELIAIDEESRQSEVDAANNTADEADPMEKLSRELIAIGEKKRQIDVDAANERADEAEAILGRVIKNLISKGNTNEEIIELAGLTVPEYITLIKKFNISITQKYSKKYTSLFQMTGAPKEVFICYFYCIAYVFVFFYGIATSLDSYPIFFTHKLLAYFCASIITAVVSPWFIYNFKRFFTPMISVISEKLLPKSIDEYLKKRDGIFISISNIVVTLLVLISLQINYLCVVGINASYTNNTPEKRYVSVESYGKDTCEVSDWQNPGRTVMLHDRNCENMALIAEVICIQTRRGLLGIEFLYKTTEVLKAFRKNEFPPDTKFPLTESQFQDLHIKKSR